MLTLILSIAAYTDLKYRKIHDWIILLIFIYAVMVSDVSLIYKMCSFIITAFSLYVICITTDKIKGGDLKYIAALSMAIGIDKLAYVFLFTTIYAVIYSTIKKQKTIPLAFFTFCGWISTKLLLI